MIDRTSLIGTLLSRHGTSPSSKWDRGLLLNSVSHPQGRSKTPVPFSFPNMKFICGFNEAVLDSTPEDMKVWRDGPRKDLPDYPAKEPPVKITGPGKPLSKKRLRDLAEKLGESVSRLARYGKTSVPIVTFLLIYRETRAKGYSREESITIALSEEVNPVPFVGYEDVEYLADKVDEVYDKARESGRNRNNALFDGIFGWGPSWNERSRTPTNFRGDRLCPPETRHLIDRNFDND
ncbi:hypothetical protein HOV93_52350 [Planctomycetes bacterium FF15]|uniref:Uncharacterized protein n=2 Tax=Bremerella alba TaxID=980252 RepID=A0A7V9AA16_9BACT|nr:hypothetical protein [Bremerella alba]